MAMALTPAAKLDWSEFGAHGTDYTGLNIDAALDELNGTSLGDLNTGVDLAVGGGVALNVLDGIIVAKGSFSVQLGTLTDLGADGLPGGTDDDADTEYQAMVLTLGSDAFEDAEKVEVFIGVGGVLEDVAGDDASSDGSFADDLVNTDGGIGVYASLESLQLVTLKDNSGTATDPSDDKSYLALQLEDLTAKLIGVEGLTFGVYDGVVKLNQFKDADTDATNDQKLDWTALDNTEGLTLPALEIDAGVDLEVQGSMVLDAFGVVLAKGSFTVQLGTLTDLGADGLPGGTDDDADTEYQAMVLTLGSDAFEDAEKVEVFIGVGGVLEDVAGDDASSDGSFADDLVNTDGGIGVYASLESLQLVTLKDNGSTATDPSDDKSYLALQLEDLTAKLIGVEGLTFGVYDGGVKLNQFKDADTDASNDQKLDWTALDNTEGLTLPALEIDAGVDLVVQGSMALDAFGVVIAKGSFSVQLGTLTDLGADGLPGGTDDDADTEYQAMVLTLGSDAFEDAEKVEVFIGVGGVLEDVAGDDASSDGSFADDLVNTDGGIGVYASLESLQLVTLKDNGGTATDPSDDKSYLALQLEDLTAKLIGVEGLTFGVYDGVVKLNQFKDADTDATNDQKLDWTALDNTEGLTLPALEIDAGVDLVVQGSMALDAFGVVIAKGSFSVQLGTLTDLGADGLPGGTDDDADTEYQAMVLTLGSDAFEDAEKVEVFIGVGGVLEDVAGDDASSDGSFADDLVNTDRGIGFYTSLESLIVVTLKNAGDPTVTTDDVSYLAIEASGIEAEFLGIPDGILTLKVWDAGFKVNQAADTDNNAIPPDKLDWTALREHRRAGAAGSGDRR